MKTRVIASILAALMILCALAVVPSGAEDADDGAGLKFTVEDGGSSVRKYTGSERELTIPAELDGYSPITAIDAEAFFLCTSLESVTIPDTVTRIGANAFKSCRSLKSVTIPSGVSELCEGVFSECTSLESVTIPEGVTVICDEAFASCTSLRSVTLPASLAQIGDMAFSDCTSLESIEVASGCKEYKSVDGSLYSADGAKLVICPRTKTNVTIPASVTELGEEFFCDRSTLESIEVEAGNEAYKTVDGILYTADGESLIICPRGVTSVDIAPGVKMICSSAFQGCASLTDVVIPEGVEIIGSWAFADCSSLSTLTLPAGVKWVYWYAFQNCSLLANVNYTGSEDDWKRTEVWGVGNDRLIWSTFVYDYVPMAQAPAEPQTTEAAPADSDAGGTAADTADRAGNPRNEYKRDERSSVPIAVLLAAACAAVLAALVVPIVIIKKEK